MGSFFVVLGEDPLEVERLHRRGASIARTLGLAGGRSMGNAWARVTAFPRENGSGGDLAVDGGRWLVAAGTWRHPRCRNAGELLRAREWKDLDGFFAIATRDSAARAIRLVTDPLGRRHLYLRRFEGAVAVATSSMLLSALGPASLDPAGTQEFVHTGVLHEERTLHREVRKVPPASIVTIASSGVTSSERWWDLRDVPVDALDGGEAVEALAASLARAGKDAHAKYPRLVSDLTGGYDSRVIACGLMEAGVPFETTVCGKPGDDDVDAAEAIARAAGLRHTTIAPDPARDVDRLRRAVLLTDGEYDAVEYSVVAEVHERLAARFDAGLNGSAGEIARGRWWEHLAPRAGARVPIDARRVAVARFAPHAMPRLFAREIALDFASHFTGVVERAAAGLGDLPNTTQMCWVYLAVRMRSWQGRIASSTDRIWPVLSPFLTRDVLTTMLSMTKRIRRRSLVVRRMLAEKRPVLARVPMSKGYPPVPFGPRTFHRFTPLATYYGRRIARKAGAMLGRETPDLPASFAELSARQHLWFDDAVRGMLEPRSMASAALFEPGVLVELLESSRRRDFRWDLEWNRLLTIEAGERTLAEARASAREDLDVAWVEEGVPG